MEHIIPAPAQNTFWTQPDRENILVSDKDAVMSYVDFLKLIEYANNDVPSDVYPGKMWKKQSLTGWNLYWFHNMEYRGGRQICLPLWRPITVFNWRAAMGVD